ncbi:MAG: DEAD/DEAH box helicase, partial [Saprospiraceae bacterium]|nr:DEAD/DEAH box helicase [Saprospiraceae bacterium]
MQNTNSLDRLIRMWEKEPDFRDNVVFWHTEPERQADWVNFPDGLNPNTILALQKAGFQHLYRHQAEAYELSQAGKHIVVTTGTASGKTLCYQLPVMDHLVHEPSARALFIFPTKALTQDQQDGVNRLLKGLEPRPSAFIYDGDTSVAVRSKVRGAAGIILTNPDMLHISILPHHTLWADFFKSLRYIVIDEIHIYRGIFGSHLTNLIRRLKRIAAFYGAHPQFILTSATIGNPQQLAERIIEESVSMVDRDGSPHGARHILLFNPPIIHPEVGIRRSASSEAVRLVSDLLAYNVQTILFTRARRSVELLLRNLREHQSQHAAAQIRGYRSG